jgi:hypothetical protein
MQQQLPGYIEDLFEKPQTNEPFLFGLFFSTLLMMVIAQPDSKAEDEKKTNHLGVLLLLGFG